MIYFKYIKELLFKYSRDIPDLLDVEYLRNISVVYVDYLWIILSLTDELIYGYQGFRIALTESVGMAGFDLDVIHHK